MKRPEDRKKWPGDRKKWPGDHMKWPGDIWVDLVGPADRRSWTKLVAQQ